MSLLRSYTAFHYADFQYCDVFDCVRNFVLGHINLYLIFLLFSKLNWNKFGRGILQLLYRRKLWKQGRSVSIARKI